MTPNLEDYEPVAIRLGKFLDAVTKDNKHPRVITDLVHYTDDRCVFRAELYEYDPATGLELLIATGWAEEIRGDGHVNKHSHLENCETGAVGRALANAGYAGTDPAKRASREEMAKVKRAQTGSAATPIGTRFITPNQIGLVKSLARGKEMDDLQTLEYIHATLGVNDVVLETLTSIQADRIIKALKG